MREDDLVGCPEGTKRQGDEGGRFGGLSMDEKTWR